MSLLLQFRGPTLLFLLVKVQAADRHPEKARRRAGAWRPPWGSGAAANCGREDRQLLAQPRICHVARECQPFHRQPGVILPLSLLTAGEWPPEMRACSVPRIHTEHMQALDWSRPSCGSSGAGGAGGKSRSPWEESRGSAGEGRELREGAHSGPAGVCATGALQVNPPPPTSVANVLLSDGPWQQVWGEGLEKVRGVAVWLTGNLPAFPCGSGPE